MRVEQIRFVVENTATPFGDLWELDAVDRLEFRPSVGLWREHHVI
jgi:hypothetical protein